MNRIYIIRNKGPERCSAETLKRDWLKEKPYCFVCKKILTKESAFLEHWIPVGIGGVPWDKENTGIVCYNCYLEKNRFDRIVINLFKELGFIERAGYELTLFMPLENIHSFYKQLRATKIGFNKIKKSNQKMIKNELKKIIKFQGMSEFPGKLNRKLHVVLK